MVNVWERLRPEWSASALQCGEISPRRLESLGTFLVKCYFRLIILIIHVQTSRGKVFSFFNRSCPTKRFIPSSMMPTNNSETPSYQRQSTTEPKTFVENGQDIRDELRWIFGRDGPHPLKSLTFDPSLRQSGWKHANMSLQYSTKTTRCGAMREGQAESDA